MRTGDAEHGSRVIRARDAGRGGPSDQRTRMGTLGGHRAHGTTPASGTKEFERVARGRHGMRGSVPEATRQDVPTAIGHGKPRDCPARARGEIGPAALRPLGGLGRDADSGRREQRQGPLCGNDVGTAAGRVTRPWAPADQAAWLGHTRVHRDSSLGRPRGGPEAVWAGASSVPPAVRRLPGDGADPCAPPSRPGPCTGSPQRRHELPEPGPARTAGCEPLARPPPHVQQGQGL